MTGVNPFQKYQVSGKIPLSLVKEHTKNFKVGLIGEGPMGEVYKVTVEGVLAAVKRHAKVTIPGAREAETYEKAVRDLMKHEHENVVKLLAFCREESKELVRISEKVRACKSQDTVEILLCYEYFDKGSLHKNLFGESARSLDWNERFEIIKGICRGLMSLHAPNPDGPILHLNLKSQNILLDNNGVPKITDFGYSRLCGNDWTHKYTTSLVGSSGYLPPEYANNGPEKKLISRRTDIYCLGIIILEITTCIENFAGKKENTAGKKKKENNGGEQQNTAKSYIEEVKKKWKNIRAGILKEYDCKKDPNQVEACIKIGLECVNSDEKARPDIKYIVQTLGAEIKDKGLAPPRA